jgi:glucose-1-phosphate cytidylyltransferase
MKVVLFCGGKGVRLGDPNGTPKPLVTVRNRPLIWHLMKYYAHYGHNDFILCLGHGAQKFKDYFLNYDECVSNDFVWSHGGKAVEPLSRDADDWRITFVETGLEANLGTRLMAVRRFLDGEEHFLANYSDGLTDCPLPALERRHAASDAVATFMTARPPVSFHFVETHSSGAVAGIHPSEAAGIWVNAGFFVLHRDIFDFIRPGEELVNEPFQRLILRGLLQTVHHRGFWQPVDTQKDLQTANELAQAGTAPWEVWRGTAAPVLKTAEVIKLPALAS